MLASAAMRIAWLVVLAACGDNAWPQPKREPPAPPAQNDPAFAISGLRHWYVIGSDDAISAQVKAPEARFVDAYVGNLPPIRLPADGALAVSLAEVPAGTHEILFSADGSDTAFAQVAFARSAAYYVLVSTDYDFSDPGAQSIQYMDWLHRDHPEMRITHFWAPYTYTDPNVTPDRQTELDTWITQQHATFGDEIGLHIHPYCTFVEHAGLTCITDRSTVYPGGDPTGYTIEVAAYGRTNFGVLLQDAAGIFAQHGLGKPRTFRAGGWTADLSTFQALVDNDFIADTSALNWARIEEWKGKELYDWTMAHWAPIDDTSQPYYPSDTDVLAHGTMPMLEVPDNGVMIDYVTQQEIDGIFDANWDGAPFATPPRTMMMGFHPSMYLSYAEYREVTNFLIYADQHLYSRDLGPVVYTTLSDVIAAFSPM